MDDILKKFSPRLFFITGLIMILLLAGIGATAYFGLNQLDLRASALLGACPETEATRAFSDFMIFLKETMPIYGAAAAGMAFLLAVLLIWIAGRSVLKGLLKTSVQKSSVPKKPGDSKQDRQERIAADRRLYLHLLSVLQREGRLLDFFAEDLAAYEDAQIGAAVRNIHENCRRVIDRYVGFRPVMEQAEGQSVTVEQGFDASALKLTGNVAGEPPFRGTIRHRGWKAGNIELPELSGGRDAGLIAPAEIEIA